MFELSQDGAIQGIRIMTFDAWLETLSLDTRENLDAWSARVGWEAAVYHLNPTLRPLTCCERCSHYRNAQKRKPNEKIPEVYRQEHEII